MNSDALVTAWNGSSDLEMQSYGSLLVYYPNSLVHPE